ncbi:Uncharacterised protein [Budvicia aquatica]|uniref:Uncharacterized protein n=1 Tax=Budvicia aquatica TaxID=82979 RepID=A0A484ZQ33_9GAMM|nr:Uncharacterised protein [Budvicia aquatica]
MTILKSGNSRSGYPYAKNMGNDIFKAYEQDISVIKFEGVKVRIINIHGEPWFVAKIFVTHWSLLILAWHYRRWMRMKRIP